MPIELTTQPPSGTAPLRPAPLLVGASNKPNVKCAVDVGSVTLS